MAYHLLPSEDYLESTAGDSAHPIASFAGDAYSDEISSYGQTINNRVELKDFLTASSLNSALIDYANDQHATLDAWIPPDGVEVSQIAGWGADTVSGIDFYTSSILSSRKYRPIFTEDGDGTVPVPSALMMASSTSVKRYWVNLAEYSRDTHTIYKHANIFETSPLQDFIKNIIENSTSTLPFYISSSQPPTNVENKKLTFFLHSPLTLQLKNSAGNITGLAEDGTISGNISGATYGEFGDVKYIIADGGANYELILHGQDTGTFSLDIQESSGGIITASSTIANVPVTPNTTVSLTLSGGIDTASALTVDVDGDGKNIITLTPKIGEIVTYQPSTPVPEPIVISAGNRGGDGAISMPTIIPVTVATTPETVATTTQPVSTSTMTTETSTKPLQTKKKIPVAVIMPKKAETNIAQTASAYNAVSQQPLFARVGRAVYNGLYGLWLTLKKLF